jgi:folate-binding Fe-S cluster repair protein YgfZ
MRLNPEHLKFALAQIITGKMARDSDKIAAIKLLGTDQGMFVQKQITAHVGLEEALASLE